jgi:hypothetical protein
MTYSIKPEKHELREARETVEKIISSCKYILEKDEDLSINLGYADKEETGEFGVFGTAKTSESAQIYFNTDVDDWRENLEDMAADVYGQTCFYENSEVNFNWQRALASITGLMLIEEISEPREIDVEELQEEWAEKKTRISDKVSAENRGNLSWQLKLAIGRELTENHDLEDLPDLNRSDVLEAGDSLFE